MPKKSQGGNIRTEDIRVHSDRKKRIYEQKKKELEQDWKDYLNHEDMEEPVPENPYKDINDSW